VAPSLVTEAGQVEGPLPWSEGCEDLEATVTEPTMRPGARGYPGEKFFEVVQCGGGLSSVGSVNPQGVN
jgi:hypothetical protein